MYAVMIRRMARRTITQRLPASPAHIIPACVFLPGGFSSAIPARRALTNLISDGCWLVSGSAG